MPWFGVGRRWLFVPQLEDQCQTRNLEVDLRLALRSCDFTARGGSSKLQTTPEIPPSVDQDAPVKSRTTG